MRLRSLTPMKPKIFLGLLAYFLLSCVIAAQINGASERITSPAAATILAVMSAVLTLFSFAPVVSQMARHRLLRPEATFGRGDKASFVFSGVVAAAFAGGFLVIAVRGVS